MPPNSHNHQMHVYDYERNISSGTWFGRPSIHHRRKAHGMKKSLPARISSHSDPPPTRHPPTNCHPALYLVGSVFLRSRSKYSVAERFSPPSGLVLSCVRFQSVTLAPTIPNVATATPKRMGPMLWPGMGWSAPTEKARVRIDAIAPEVEEEAVLGADAAAREKRAAVQRATLGAIRVTVEDILCRRGWIERYDRGGGSFGLGCDLL